MAGTALRPAASAPGLTRHVVNSPDLDPDAPSGKGASASATAPTGDPLWDSWDTAPRVPDIPVLHLDGFDGPMDLLLDLAERQRVDFGRMSILTLAEQFSAALQLLEDRVSIERKADWLVLATRLVLLRSRLLFPQSAAAPAAPRREEVAALRRIGDLASLRAAVAWLEARPQLNQDVFARGQPEAMGLHLEAAHEIDVIDFLWASLAVFDDDLDDVGTGASYRPHWLELYSMTDARARILERLAEHPEGLGLAQLLPTGLPAIDASDQATVRRRSAWTSVFAASLEMAKQGEVCLAQAKTFASIHITCSTTRC
jgi:segregation and condensation protein A